jgi:UDP-sugar transporter A1/2/3
VLLLNRVLSSVQWFSLLLLSMGVAFVQLGSTVADSHPVDAPVPVPTSLNATYGWLPSRPSIARDSDELPAVTAYRPHMNQLLGLVTVVLASLSSGFASTYFERCLKVVPPPRLNTPLPNPPPSSAAPSPNPLPKRQPSLWIRNIQLSLFGLSMAVLLMFAETHKSTLLLFWNGLLPSTPPDASASSAVASTAPSITPFLDGFTPLVHFVVFLQIIGGLLAALVIKYADNIGSCPSCKLYKGAKLTKPDKQLKDLRRRCPSSFRLPPRSSSSTTTLLSALSLAAASSLLPPSSSTAVSRGPPWLLVQEETVAPVALKG